VAITSKDSLAKNMTRMHVNVANWAKSKKRLLANLM
jgi:hypothetical protein